MNCCICENNIADKQENNAQPVKDGWCCDECNATIVLPARIASLLKPDEENK